MNKLIFIFSVLFLIGCSSHEEAEKEAQIEKMKKIMGVVVITSEPLKNWRETKAAERKIMKLILLLIFISFTSPASAAVPTEITDGFLDIFQSSIAGFQEAMIHAGGQLLMGLLFVQITWNGANHFLRSSHDTFLEALGNILLKPLLPALLFLGFIQLFPVWGQYIVNEWIRVGANASHISNLDAATIIGHGVDIVEKLRTAVFEKFGLTELLSSFILILVVGVCYFLILLAHIILAGQMILVQIRAMVWIAVTPIFFRFWRFKTFRDVAVHSAKGAISLGALIIATYFVAGIAEGALPIWEKFIDAFSVTELSDWKPLWYLMTLAFLILMAAWTVPKMAADLVTGSISGGLEETMATAAAGLAAAAKVAEISTSAGKNAAGAGLEQLRKLTAPSQTPGLGGSVAQPAGQGGQSNLSALQSGGQSTNPETRADNFRSAGAQLSGRRNSESAFGMGESQSGSAFDGGGGATAYKGDDRMGSSSPGTSNSSTSSSDQFTSAAMSAAQHSSVEAARASTSLGTNSTELGDASTASLTGLPGELSFAQRMATSLENVSKGMPGSGSATVGVNANIGSGTDD